MVMSLDTLILTSLSLYLNLQNFVVMFILSSCSYCLSLHMLFFFVFFLFSLLGIDGDELGHFNINLIESLSKLTEFCSHVHFVFMLILSKPSTKIQKEHNLFSSFNLHQNYHPQDNTFQFSSFNCTLN